MRDSFNGWGERPFMKFEAVIGLEVHAELLTQSKMFCSCPVVDLTRAAPNIAVCPVCAGMPGVLPVVNKKAIEYAIRVGLALNCEIATTSIFERKNYFYPDLPKGYQITQYEYPLAKNGHLVIHTTEGERSIRIRRAHLEEDTGKLTHIDRDGEAYSLVDFNRAGVPLLEIVTEPDMHKAKEVRAYAEELRSIIRYLGVNSGDMSKGVMRFEANVSVRPPGSDVLNTRVEIKNLNSFRSLERAVVYQIEQQSLLLEQGEPIQQETLGWDEARGVTYSQRGKEEAHDYRYFPEPDLPPLVIDKKWIMQIAANLPELPYAKASRFQKEFGLSVQDAHLLVEEQAVADYFEQSLHAGPDLQPRTSANWITGELFGWMNQSGEDIHQIKVKPAGLADLVNIVDRGEVNFNTAKMVLVEMLETGKSAATIIANRGLLQVSDTETIARLVEQVLLENQGEVASYLEGKETLSKWFFGQVMHIARGRANPQVIRTELVRQLAALKVSRKE